jgi:hypothetical protein
MTNSVCDNGMYGLVERQDRSLFHMLSGNSARGLNRITVNLDQVTCFHCRDCISRLTECPFTFDSISILISHLINNNFLPFIFVIYNRILCPYSGRVYTLCEK